MQQLKVNILFTWFSITVTLNFQCDSIKYSIFFYFVLPIPIKMSINLFYIDYLWEEIERAYDEYFMISFRSTCVSLRDEMRPAEWWCEDQRVLELRTARASRLRSADVLIVRCLVFMRFDKSATRHNEEHFSGVAHESRFRWLWHWCWLRNCSRQNRLWQVRSTIQKD